jgi:hypothetical protein
MSHDADEWINKAMQLADAYALAQHDWKNTATERAARQALHAHLKTVPTHQRKTATDICLPAKGTLERVIIDKMAALPPGRGVTYLDFVGTGITEENIDQLVQNLRTGMYRSDEDDAIKFDA